MTAVGVLFECYICMNIHSHKPSRACDIDSTSLLSRYGGFGIKVTRRAAERDLGKAQESGGPEVCGCSRQHLYVQFYEKTECHKDTSQLLMLETQPSSGGGGGDFAEFVDGVGAGAVGFGGETAGTAGRSCGTGIVDGSNGLWTAGSGTGDDAATTPPSRIFL